MCLIVNFCFLDECDWRRRWRVDIAVKVNRSLLHLDCDRLSPHA